MKLSHNLLAGVANSVWSALIGLAVVPFYIRYLGIESYGLVGIFITMQALLQLLDMGMAPTINREVARCSALGNLKESGTLLHTLAIVYWSMAGLIAAVILAMAPLIAKYWLQSKNLSPQVITHAVILMGLVVACRWPIGLYQGALIGAQRLTVASGVAVVMSTLGSLGAVLVLRFISPTIEAFFIWQASVGILYAIVMRLAAWRIIGRVRGIKFDSEKLKSVWRFTAGMSGIGFASLLLTQLDKVILSKVLSLEEFGHYMLATVVVNGLYLLVTPLFNVVYPRFSGLVAAGEIGKITDLYRLGARTLAVVLFPIAMVLAVFAKDLVLVWTSNPAVASNVAPIIALLAIGSALHGVMYFPYALQLAYGLTRLPLLISTLLTIALVPLITFFALTYGALGGAMAWLALQIFYVLLGTWLTHRSLLKGVGARWLFQDVGIPLLVSVLVGLIGCYVAYISDYSILVKLMCAAVLAFVAFVLSVLMSPQLIAIARNNWERRNSA